MFLYLITNKLNGRQYVGVTRRSIKKRWREHVSDAARGCGFLIHRAIRKHHPESFHVSIIAAFDSLQDLLNAEVESISKLSTRSPGGYNLTNGGEGTFGRKVSGATKRKISLAHRGKRLSQEHRKKLSVAKTGIKLGPFTEDHCHKIAKARMGHGFSKSALLKMSIAKSGKPWSKARRDAYVSKLLQ